MTPLKAFGIGVKVLIGWLLMIAFTVVTSGLFEFWWGDNGLVLMIGVWAIPVITYWSYLLYREEWKDADK